MSTDQPLMRSAVRLVLANRLVPSAFTTKDVREAIDEQIAKHGSLERAVHALEDLRQRE